MTLTDPSNETKWRTGLRASDASVGTHSPFDRRLHDVGRLTDGHNIYVRLMCAETGRQFARSRDNRLAEIWKL